MPEIADGVTLDCFGYDRAAGITMRCTTCQVVFTWPSKSLLHHEVPQVGLNFCPGCGKPVSTIITLSKSVIERKNPAAA